MNRTTSERPDIVFVVICQAEYEVIFHTVSHWNIYDGLPCFQTKLFLPVWIIRVAQDRMVWDSYQPERSDTESKQILQVAEIFIHNSVTHEN